MSGVAPKRPRTAAVRGDSFGEEAGMDAGQTTSGQVESASHSVDVGAFAQRFSQIPVIIGCVFSFLSLHLVAALPQRLWRHVCAQITHLVMDTYNTAE
ncbi:unnamed protein product [Vitrella brassicaformis CCMP3155]|uniref:Uncharacterized protein n=1 Tax=Vitrella brassicaformis (strain CCMP3155) TaxID=1169540 RepID=A0A0G4E936_VITBC|nr:unnamed protein product [Vitrella brassicaformis CCMP3155]|eukprot:CEL91720.1 unnamed protein product [Vitrella brassicaformis CCMP3155]